MMRCAIWWSAAGALALGLLSPAMARPQYLMTFKAHYKTAAGKPTLNAANCSLCHIGTPAPGKGMWNPYGQAVKAALGGAMNCRDRAKIEAALVAAEASKRVPNARHTFVELIARDRLPAGGPAGGHRAPGARAAARESSATWRPLFNGQNLDGWEKVNQGNWVVENGLLKYTGGGNGWLRSRQQYGNYSLVVVWRYPRPGNNDSGIFLKAKHGDEGHPWPGSPQLNMGTGQSIGSIGGAHGSRNRYDLIKPNDWNTFQVTVDNGAATVAINGQVAWDMATHPGLIGPGHVGIQAEGFPLEVSQVWIMSHP